MVFHALPGFCESYSVRDLLYHIVSSVLKRVSESVHVPI